ELSIIVPADPQHSDRRQRQFHQQHAVQYRRSRLHCRREIVLSMAAVRYRSWLQHFESCRQPAAARRHGRVPQRALPSPTSPTSSARMKLMSKLWYRARLSALDLIGDRRGLAAIEFAMLVPIMLVMFFGTVELSSGVAVDRKVTLVARTLSDLTSQSDRVDDGVLTN